MNSSCGFFFKGLTMQEPTRLNSRDRVLLCASAVALAPVTGMLQCAALSVGSDMRAMLTLGSALIAALAVSVLVEDMLAVPLRQSARGLVRRTPRQHLSA